MITMAKNSCCSKKFVKQAKPFHSRICSSYLIEQIEQIEQNIER
jgi:hypothetical protein